jgi:hypothetical protein
MPTATIAVIAGFDFEGEVFHTLRLFDCKSTADAYAKHLEEDYDYVLTELRGICMESALCAA